MSREKTAQNKTRQQPGKVKATRSVRTQDPVVNSSMEEAVGVTVQDLFYLLKLEAVKGFGPQKFKLAFEAGLRPKDLLNDPSRIVIKGKRGGEIQRSIAQIVDQDNEAIVARAKRYIDRAHRYAAQILTYWHPLYPQIVYRSNYPTPILFVRGSKEVLKTTKAIACVGSRKIRPPYSERHREFAEFSSKMGFTVVAGFALGADTIGHKAAIAAGGSTICVMGGGLDRAFPPENKELWEELLQCPRAVFVSEVPFGARARGLTLRKRNKLIVAFSLGVLVSQSAERGGTMNAYRFSLEQHKPVSTFLDDGAEDTAGNKVVSRSTKTVVSTFKSGESHYEAWQRWLQQLSFSI